MVAHARRYQLPILITLLLAVGLELALHRVCLQFLKPEVLEPESDLFRLFNGGVGPLFFYFASLVGLAACAWSLLGVVREEGTFALPWRVVLGLFSCVFLPVCAVGIFVSNAGLKPLSQSLRELHPYLNLFFAPMLVVLVAALWARPGHPLAKAGVLLYVLPFVGFAFFSYRPAMALRHAQQGVSVYEPLRQVSAIPKALRSAFIYGGPIVCVAFIPLAQGTRTPVGTAERGRNGLWPALFTHVQALFETGPLVAGLGLGVLVGVGVKLGFEPLRVVMDAAFALDLPHPSGAALLWLGSVSLYAWTVFSLAWHPGPTRTVALGLVCLGVAGIRLGEPLHSLQLPDPLYYLLAVTGLLALCVGIAGVSDREASELLRERSPVIPDDRWLAFLGRCDLELANGSVHEPAVRRLVDQEVEIAGVEGRHQGIPTTLYVRRREGRVESLSLVLGEALGQVADWGVAPRGGRWWRRRKAPEPFVVKDRAALSDRLLGKEIRALWGEAHQGTLEVWLNVGLRYRFQVRSPEDLGRLIPTNALAQAETPLPPPSGILTLIELLYDVARRAGVVGRPEASVTAEPPGPDPGIAGVGSAGAGSAEGGSVDPGIAGVGSTDTSIAGVGSAGGGSTDPGSVGSGSAQASGIEPSRPQPRGSSSDSDVVPPTRVAPDSDGAGDGRKS